MISTTVFRFMPDVAVSLCGGLDNPEAGGKELSSTLFEQSLLTFDDFVLRIRESKDILSDPDLVVRIGDKYYNWQTGGPMIMSAVLYGRSLPAELIKEYDEKSKTAASSSPNSKAARSSWWPWRRGGMYRTKPKTLRNELSDHRWQFFLGCFVVKFSMVFTRIQLLRYPFKNVISLSYISHSGMQLCIPGSLLESSNRELIYAIRLAKRLTPFWAEIW